MSNRTAVAIFVVAACMLQGRALHAAVVAETHRLQEAPYYVDVGRRSPATGTCAVVLPATPDPEFAQTFGYEKRVGDIEPLITAVNARIDAKQGCVRAAREAPMSAGAPRVYVGSADSDYAPIDVGDERVPGDRFAPMVLQLARPGAEWRREVAGIVARAGVDHAIAIQVGVSQYMKGYSGVFRKEVALGTGYRKLVKFLTAEDKPVEVLHLTGVLVDAHGKVIRAGAEGVTLRDTPFLAQAIEVSRMFDDRELARVLTDERRQDLPGEPLAIDIALDNLLAQLTRGEIRVPAK
jgi:hypothetical protein